MSSCLLVALSFSGGIAEAQTAPYNREALDFAFVPTGVPDTYQVYLVWRAGSRSGGADIDLSTEVAWGLGAPFTPTSQPMVGGQIDLCTDLSGACGDQPCGVWDVGGDLREGCCGVEASGACSCHLVFVTPAPAPVVLQAGDTVYAVLRGSTGSLTEIETNDDTLVAVFNGPKALGNRSIAEDGIYFEPTSVPGRFDVSVRGFAEVGSTALGWVLDAEIDLEVDGVAVGSTFERLRSPAAAADCAFGCSASIPCGDWTTSTSSAAPGRCRPSQQGMCVCSVPFQVVFRDVAIDTGSFVSALVSPSGCSFPEAWTDDDTASVLYEPSHPACGASELVENNIVPHWPQFPTKDSAAVMSGTVLDLRIENERDDRNFIDVVGHVHAAGQRKAVSFGRFLLGLGETRTLAIDLADLEVDLGTLEYSGRLTLEVRSRNRRRMLVEREFLPSLYFHQEIVASGAVETHVYREDARRTLYNCGDFNFLLFPDGAPEGTIGIFDGGNGRGTSGEDSGPLVIDDFLGASNWEFCMRWVYESIDSGFGEDHYQAGTLMKARGMKVSIDHPNWIEPKDFFCTKNNGCLQFAASENSGFIVTIYAESLLGTNDNLTVRAFDTKLEAQLDPEDVPTWTFIANPGGLPRRVYYQNEPGEQSNLMAFGSFILHWVDSHTAPGLAGPENLYLVSDNPSCDGSCQPGNFVEMQPGKTNRKFLVGHEVGHWIHRQWTNDNMGYDNWSWSANSSDPDCAFDGVGAHAMRSKEYAVGGFIEGFAHFISALAWNDHNQTNGWFKYYKEVEDATYNDMEANNWRVDLEAAGNNPIGGVTNWQANACFVNDGHSVEMDWLRFFWDYRTNPGVKPSHHDIFTHVGFTMANHPWGDNLGAYDQLWIAIQDGASGLGAFVDRWLDAAEWNGVAQ